MFKFLEYFFWPFNFYRSLKRLRRLEATTLENDGDLFMIPFIYEGHSAFNSIRPKQVIYEIQSFYEIVKALDAKYVCEIGTFRGGTFYLWCKAACEDATLISIDLPSDNWNKAFSPERRKFYQKFAKSSQQNLHFLPADSHQQSTKQQLVKLLSSEQLDFLFIDGDHSYAGVKQDFELYKPLVRPGGVIAFHDILPRVEFPNIEVYKLWEELKTQYSYREIIAREGEYANLTGIGVIWV